MTAELSQVHPAKANLWKRWLVRISLAAGAALLSAALACYFFPQKVLTVDSGEVKADVLVVLGGGSQERPARAAELFKTGQAPLIVCTGFGDGGANEACLTNAGVPASAILLESRSRTTRENAQFSVPLLRAHGVKRAIIVTDWFHSRRALACFEHYAPDIKFYSRPSYVGYPKAEWNRTGISGYVKSEYWKLLGYWLRYGVCPI